MNPDLILNPSPGKEKEKFKAFILWFEEGKNLFILEIDSPLKGKNSIIVSTVS